MPTSSTSNQPILGLGLASWASLGSPLIDEAALPLANRRTPAALDLFYAASGIGSR
jgi:hypothetical protein